MRQIRRLTGLLKNHRIACVFSALLLSAQAFFSLAAPALLGDMIDTGALGQGYKEDVPFVLSANTFDFLLQTLPDAQSDELAGWYGTADEMPEPIPDAYQGKTGCYYLLPDADRAEAAELYRNAVWTVILAARESGRLEQYDFDALADRVSLASMILYAQSVSLTPSQIGSLFREAEQAEPALKKQMAALLIPYIYEDAGLDTDVSRSEFVTKTAALLILCAALQFASAFAADLLVARLSVNAESELRSLLLRICMRFGKRELSSRTPAHLRFVHRDGVTQIGMSIRYGFRILFYAPVLAIAGSVLTFRKSPTFGVVILCSAGFIISAVTLIYHIAKNRYYRMQKNYESYSARVRTLLRQMFTVRNSGAQSYENRMLSQASESIRKDELFVLRAVLVGLSAAGLTVNLLTALVVALGMNSMLSSDMISIGSILTYTQYAILVTTAFMMLGLTVIFAPKAVVALRDIDTILSTEPESKKYENNTSVPGTVREVTFSAVRLFPGSPEVNFTAERGTLTLITGGTGTGKSLIFDVLMREFEPAEGKAMINGVDVVSFSAGYPSDTVVRAVSQPVLYSASVRENFRMHGAPDDDNILLDALEKAECGFLPSGMSGLDVMLENAGTSYSGGQRSRLSMAAGFARKGGIYIFDDCLTSVDHGVRRRILDRIAALKDNAVVFLITQDLADLPEFDRKITFYRDRIEISDERGNV
ncbi:MAG: ABC transporter ATP-binding protein/permease [Clostridia bacterium]|nr:ABC transporter ATP-binding protein/permease [Clostridia bacterium]